MPAGNGSFKVEDGKGLPLGRSLRVKLWPTLVICKGGETLLQVARPDREEVPEGLEAITEGA